MDSKYNSIIKNLLTNFENYKHYCGYKYEKGSDVLVMFDKYYEEIKINEIKLTRDIIEPFLILKENERIGNQESKASVIRQLCIYAFRNGYVNKFYLIPPISKKGEKEYIPYIFSKKELLDIINYFNNYDETVRINKGTFKMNLNMMNSIKLIIEILIYTGMRVREACQLDYNNLNLEDNYFIVKEAKNDNERIVPFSNNLKDKIMIYLNDSSIYRKANTKKLFFSINKDNNILNIDTRTIYHYFRKALKYLNIPHKKGKGPRVHDFRHTAATMILTKLVTTEKNINNSIAYLSTYLGHKSFKETQKYIWLTSELMNPTLNKMKDYSSIINDIFKDGDYFE